jgi:Asp-tRNA(Asn)/Glu-tRNA(Gln) amidotransferase A subunit family amidase
MPFGTHENGLPMGIQAQARQAGDGLLMQLAAQVERALGGKWNGGAVPKHHVTHL